MVSSPTRARATRFGGALWTFVNSGFGLWLLSTFVISGGVWLYQQWRDYRATNLAIAEQIDHLDLEAAGRISQFLSWFDQNMSQQLPDGKRGFRANVTADQIRTAIMAFREAPDKGVRPGLSVDIAGILPELKERNLLSIYSELALLNDKSLKALGLEEDYKNLSESNKPRLVRLGSTEDMLTRYAQREMHNSDAMRALLEPSWLINYKDPDYTVFRDRFTQAFLNKDLNKYGFPYTDCFDC